MIVVPIPNNRNIITIEIVRNILITGVSCARVTASAGEVTCVGVIRAGHACCAEDDGNCPEGGGGVIRHILSAGGYPLTIGTQAEGGGTVASCRDTLAESRDTQVDTLAEAGHN